MNEELQLGRKAAALRTRLQLSPATVAQRAGVSERDVVTFENSGDVPVRVMLAIHRAISGDSDVSQLFSVPKFRNLDEVVAFEERRRTAR